MLDEGGAGRAKAVGRTRVRRGQVQPRLSLNDKGDVSFGPSIEGEVALPEGDAEVFDDTDFYQEVLRDVIHAKSGSAFHLFSFLLCGRMTTCEQILMLMNRRPHKGRQ